MKQIQPFLMQLFVLSQIYLYILPLHICFGEHNVGQYKDVVDSKKIRVFQVDVLDRVFVDIAPKSKIYNRPYCVPRGGKIALQFAVSSETDCLCKLSVTSIERTDGTILKANVNIYHVYPVHVEANNNGGSKTAKDCRPPTNWMHYLIRKAPFDVAEVLIETNEVMLKAEQWYSVLIDVSIQDNAETGIYSGILKLDLNGQESEVTFSLEVYKAVIPHEPLLKYITHWLKPVPQNLIEGKPPTWWSDEHFELLEKAGSQLRLYGDNIMKTPLITVDAGIDVPLISTTKKKNNTYEFDFTNFDRWFELFRTMGFKYIVGHFVNGSQHEICALPVIALDERTGKIVEIFNQDSDPEQWIAFLDNFFGKFYAHLRNKGWIDYYMQYLSDEHIDINSYKRLSLLLHTRMPGVKSMDANHSGTQAEFSRFIDIHVFSVFRLYKNPDVASWRRNKSLPTMFYHCCSPYPPYPNRHLDDSLCCSRLYPWLTYFLKSDGYLWWAANNYRGADPYSSSIGPVPGGSQNPGHPPGDNWMFYPCPDGLRPSMRMVAFREGLIDHTLLTMLARKDARKADRITKTVVRSLTDYEREPGPYHEARKALLDALSEFSPGK